MRRKRLFGLVMGTIAALLWGISGPASEMLFDHQVDVAWLISSKMLIAGVITMVLAWRLQGKTALLAPWRERRASGQLLIFILFGMLAMQYIYFKAVAVANAPTATILQFLSPVLVLIYVALQARQLPRRTDVLIIALAMFGTLLVVTKGQLTALAITPQALAWGLMAALAAAAYAILPAQLLKRHSPLVVTAWAQLLGGIAMTVVRPFWVDCPHLTIGQWGAYAFVVIGGTIVAYLLYLISLQYVSVTAVSLLDAFEPLGATVTAVVFFGFHLGFFELIGGTLIIITVLLMSITEPKAP
ncbi:DMT family transporter [Lacticaseibacillus baoqingensis]|uniref:DMT family transporter n=1 Tax=Lacticaseibacillus baoqingensis TaxID=2486013 RepID=A0ABW4E6J6_9LACO|nr:DMT family transporter [Lacticaseibacillus baoqingensis]